VAYTTWPTLDPLHHPTEATAQEEEAIRRALGDPELIPIREYDNDGVAVDPSLHLPTERFRAGVFAAYHAYPYYPDFLILEESFARATSSFGPSRYLGYLQALKAITGRSRSSSPSTGCRFLWATPTSSRRDSTTEGSPKPNTLPETTA
jgi:hypothetical protein